MAREFRMRNPRMVGSSARHDLYVDGQPVLVEVGYTVAHTYCLKNMADDDTYQEEHMTVAQTGKELRESHNKMELELAAMPGGYKPELY